MKTIRTLFLKAEVAAGSMNPQLQIQITPLHWSLAASIQLRDRWPVKIAAKVGPIAVSVWARRLHSYDFEAVCETEYSPSATFEKDD